MRFEFKSYSVFRYLIGLPNLGHINDEWIGVYLRLFNELSALIEGYLRGKNILHYKSIP